MRLTPNSCGGVAPRANEAAILDRRPIFCIQRLSSTEERSEVSRLSPNRVLILQALSVCGGRGPCRSRVQRATWLLATDVPKWNGKVSRWFPGHVMRLTQSRRRRGLRAYLHKEQTKMKAIYLSRLPKRKKYASERLLCIFLQEIEPHYRSNAV